MKRFLSAGEGYALLRMNILLLFFFMCLQTGHADTTVPVTQGDRAVVAVAGDHGPKHFQIGDKLPHDFVIGYDPFDEGKKYSLRDFRGRAVIIDLWATWCSACIGRFPHMDSLSRTYGDKLEIVLVAVLGRDTPEAVRTFIDAYREKYPDLSLTFMIEENRYHDDFSFRSLPHYIWIDPNRRIRAFTNPQAFQDENLQRLLAGRQIFVPIKTR